MDFLRTFAKIIFDVLFPLRPAEVLVQATTFSTCKKLFSPQVLAIRDAQVISLLPYSAPETQALCIEAKFHKSQKAYELLGKVLATYIRYKFIEKNLKETARKVVIAPIPLGASRRAERGYNQVEEITKQAIEFLNASMETREIHFEAEHKQPRSEAARNIGFRESIVKLDTTLLIRTKETKPQMTLGRAERLKNMTDVFEARAPLFSDTLYIVIDDVVTTGSTLAAARVALLRSGAKHIILLALAH